MSVLHVKGVGEGQGKEERRMLMKALYSISLTNLIH
jgi:hypothetical protein